MELFNILKEKIKEKEVVTPKEMAIIDDNAEFLGIPKILLMENAGKVVYEEIKDIEAEEYVIFCGTGNNGGDGFVVARHLGKGEVVLIGKEGEIKTYEARENFKILKNLAEFGNIKIREIRIAEEVEDIFERLKDKKAVVVDAMIGTGVKGELREPFKTIVNKINELKKINKDLFVVSVDVETGNLESDLTITFYKRKTINKENAIVKEIGIPKEAEYVVGWGDLKALRKRDSRSHKGQNGKVLIIGGSRDFFGAPILAGLAASKIADLVGILSVDDVVDKLNNPEFIMYRVEGDYLSSKHVDYALDVAKKYDVVVLGNGFGVNDETKAFVNEFLLKYDKKAVIDADAIKVIDYNNFKFSENYVFTPHRKEFEYMNIDLNNIEEIKSTIVLKGKYDIIFNANNVKINKTGNAGLTKGGTGDVLAGLIGALFAVNDAFISACCGAFINGYAGDLLLKEKGYCFTPLDLIEKIPNVLKIFE
ncbi:bifunctional ADP-dependent NAD(P)H-hydrate dehydratase/NAD(P)H-hydrate epimerase [Methanocaldococcus fervens]|nr:bifunctional ADP-dependent NAD(P)H-hydrate dehydratase/NAD(P)H-hydrate epimerase [Methanocaldococcus fervens]